MLLIKRKFPTLAKKARDTALLSTLIEKTLIRQEKDQRTALKNHQDCNRQSSKIIAEYKLFMEIWALRIILC
jgi:hypothetical protein